MRINKLGALIQVIGASGSGKGALQNPVSMAIDPQGCLYVLDAKKRVISKYDGCGRWTGDIDCVLQSWPLVGTATLAIGVDGSIYVGEPTQCRTTRIYRRDASGCCQGYTDIEGQCTQLTTDKKGALVGLFSEGNRIIRFSGQRSFVARGTYVTKVLDSRIEQCQWHRSAFDAEVPQKASLQIDYYASDTPIDHKALTDEDWRRFLSSPYKGITTTDALFEDAVGQYLVLRLQLMGDSEHTPRITMGRIYFQRDSYLRYLPDVYQEDERGREFLERFLSVFETLSLDIEGQIAQVSQYWNVDAVAGEFVDWLGSWLAISKDDNWPLKKKQEFLRESFRLYKAHGTPAGLRRAVELFTGREARILEHLRLRPPMVLGQQIQVGLTTYVARKPTQRLVLEESSTIGDFVLAEEPDPPEKAFEEDAYDFTIVADTSELTDESQIGALRRLIEAEKPAHTRCFLRMSAGQAGQTGRHNLLGVDTILGSGFEPMRLGIRAVLGQASVLGTRPVINGTIGVRARIAVDAVLH